MKCIISAVYLVLICQSALSNSISETNAVIDTLIELIGSAPESTDVFYGDDTEDEELIPAFDTFDSLFQSNIPTDMPGSDWSASDRRGAFCRYIEQLGCDEGAISNNLGVAKASIALQFCMEHGYTNSLDTALSILSRQQSLLKNIALLVFERFAIPSTTINSTVNEILTNTFSSATIDRNNMYAVYGGKLIDAYNSGNTCVATNGALMLYRNFSGGAGGKALDMTLLTMFPTYEASSNRLEVANQSLGWKFASPSIVQYFTTVTNQLHQAAQPLPVVPELSPTP